MPLLNLNLNATDPAAPTGHQNVVWAADGMNVTAYDPNLVGDSGSGGKAGNAPAPSTGDAAAGKFLKADGTWAVPSAAGLGGSWTSYTPTVSGSGSMTVSSLTINDAQYVTIGPVTHFKVFVSLTTGGTASTVLYISLPVPMVGNNSCISMIYTATASWSPGFAYLTAVLGVMRRSEFSELVSRRSEHHDLRQLPNHLEFREFVAQALRSFCDIELPEFYTRVHAIRALGFEEKFIRI